MRPVKYKSKVGEEILSFLESKKDTAVTVMDILKDLKRKKQSTNITTVYRQLEKFIEEKKVIAHSAKDGKKIMYQYIAGQEDCLKHLHIQCVKCSKIIHLDCDESEDFTSHIEKEHGIALDYSKTLLFGLCSECR